MCSNDERSYTKEVIIIGGILYTRAKMCRAIESVNSCLVINRTNNGVKNREVVVTSRSSFMGFCSRFKAL